MKFAGVVALLLGAAPLGWAAAQPAEGRALTVQDVQCRGNQTISCEFIRSHLSILVMAAAPLIAAFYLLEDTLQTSLRLGFNSEVVRALENSSANLRTLGKLDPENRAQYRATVR